MAKEVGAPATEDTFDEDDDDDWPEVDPDYEPSPLDDRIDAVFAESVYEAEQLAEMGSVTTHASDLPGIWYRLPGLEANAVATGGLVAVGLGALLLLPQVFEAVVGLGLLGMIGGILGASLANREPNRKGYSQSMAALGLGFAVALVGIAGVFSQGDSPAPSSGVNPPGGTGPDYRIDGASCSVSDGIASYAAKVTNLGSATKSFQIVVTFFGPNGKFGSGSDRVSVPAQGNRGFQATAPAAGVAQVQCNIEQVIEG